MGMASRDEISDLLSTDEFLNYELHPEGTTDRIATLEAERDSYRDANEAVLVARELKVSALEAENQRLKDRLEGSDAANIVIGAKMRSLEADLDMANEALELTRRTLGSWDRPFLDDAVSNLLFHYAELEQQLAEARKDTERLDWLETECNGSLLVASGKLPRRKGDTLRAALDAARKATGSSPKPPSPDPTG